MSEHKIESEVVGCRFMATAPHGRSILLLGGGISVPLIVEQQIVRVPKSLKALVLAIVEAINSGIFILGISAATG